MTASLPAIEWQPHDRSPAPDELRRVQAFANTWNPHFEEELLGTTTALEKWARQQGFRVASGSATAADLKRAVAFRATIRSLAEANAAVVAGQSINVDTQPLQLVFRRSSVALDESLSFVVQAKGVDAALGSLLLDVVNAERGGLWPKLKMCASPDCGWVFFDRSKNCRGRWCSMSICGNRAKVGAFRNRRSVRSVR